MVACTCEDKQQLKLLSNLNGRFSYTSCHELSYEHIRKFWVISCQARTCKVCYLCSVIYTRRLIPCHELSYEHIRKFLDTTR